MLMSMVMHPLQKDYGHNLIVNNQLQEKDASALA